MTLGRIAGAAATVVLGCLAAGALPMMGVVQAQTGQPGLHLDLDEIRAIANRVRAGRSLQLIDHIQAQGDVWFATHEQVARYVKEEAGL